MYFIFVLISIAAILYFVIFCTVYVFLVKLMNIFQAKVCSSWLLVLMEALQTKQYHL